MESCKYKVHAVVEMRHRCCPPAGQLMDDGAMRKLLTPGCGICSGFFKSAVLAASTSASRAPERTSDQPAWILFPHF